MDMYHIPSQNHVIFSPKGSSDSLALFFSILLLHNLLFQSSSTNTHFLPLELFTLATSLWVKETYQVCPEKVYPLLIEREWFVQYRCNLEAKKSGLECESLDNDDFTVLVSGGDRRH